MVDERKEEQRMAAAERQRLDDILNMCAEYERQLERERVTGGAATTTNATKRDSCDSLKSDATAGSGSSSRNSMTKIKTNGSLTMLATSPTLAHKDGVGMTSASGTTAASAAWARRSSNSSASEDDLSGDNGTIKRRPPNGGNGATPNGSGFDSSIGNSSVSSPGSVNLSAFGLRNVSGSKSPGPASANTTNNSLTADGMDFSSGGTGPAAAGALYQRPTPPYTHQSVSHDSAIKHVTSPRAAKPDTDVGMRLHLIGTTSPLEKPEPWSPTDAQGPRYDPSLQLEPVTPTSSGIGTASNDSLDRAKVSSCRISRAPAQWCPLKISDKMVCVVSLTGEKLRKSS